MKQLSPAAIDSYLDLLEISAPGTPAANLLRLYAKDKSGVSNLYFKKDDGVEIEVGSLRDSGGPTQLAPGSIGDGLFLKRSGTSIIGATPPGGSLVYSDASIPAGNTTTSTSETTLASTYTIPASSLISPAVVKVKLWGTYGGTVVPSLTVKLKVGGTTFLTTASVSGLGTGTNAWFADLDLSVQSTGASGSVEADGFFEFSTAATTSLSVNPTPGAFTVDTTAAQAITVTVQWGAGGTGQTLTLRAMAVYIFPISTIAGSSAYTTIQSDGVDNTQRAVMNFIGGAIHVGDGASKTEVRSGDPTTMSFIQDEFCAGNVASGSIGDLGWTFSNGTFSVLAGESGRPGIARHAGSTSGIISRLALRSSAATGIILASELFDITFIIRLNHNDTNTTIRFGVSSDSSSATPADGIYWEKLNDANANWFRVTRASSTQTRNDHGTAIDTSFHRFRIRRADATMIKFSIDGGTEATHSTNVPSAAVSPFVHIVPAVSSEKSYDIDYFSQRILGLAR